MTLPANLVSAQWYQGLNTDKIVDFVFLLGVPMEDSKGKGKGKAKGKDSPKDDGSPNPVVWFNKMSLDTTAVETIHYKLQELAMHAREKRVSDDEVSRRFNALQDDISILLIGDDNKRAAESPSRDDEEVATEVDAEASTTVLESTNDNIATLVSLFDLNRGMDDSHPAVCNWLRSILVPQM